MSKKLKIAVLSAWHVHADEYTKEFADNERVELALVWDDDKKRGEEFANKYGVPFVADLDEVLKMEDIDGVCITTSTNLHAEIMVKVAEAKKHIFTEKVLTFTKKEALVVKEAVERNKIKFCISFIHRGYPHNLFAKKVVDEKLIGEVTLLRVRNAHDGAVSGWLPESFYNEELCGGGAMMDLGAHPMYLANWLMGKAKSVSSTFTKYTGKAVDDNCVSVMQYENGAIAISETGFVSKNSPYSLEICGTEGSLLINMSDNSVKLNSNLINKEVTGWLEVTNLPEKSDRPIKQFVDAILDGTEIDYTIDDAVMLTEIMEAAYVSYRENKTVNL